MQNVKRTRREISRLVLTIAMACMMAPFVLGCDPDVTIPPVPDPEASTAQDVAELQKEISQLRQAHRDEVGELKKAHDAAYKALQDSLPGLVAAEAKRRSCVRPATFTVHHDGQQNFRGEVEASLKPLGALLTNDGGLTDIYHAEDITEAQFNNIIGTIKATADAHDIKLPLGSISDFPPCDPVVEASSEHLPAFGEEMDHCEVVGHWIVQLKRGSLPEASEYWMYYEGQIYDEKAIKDKKVRFPIRADSCQQIYEIDPVPLYAMVIRDQKPFKVVSYRYIEAPDHRTGVAGARIKLPDVNRQPACPPSSAELLNPPPNLPRSISVPVEAQAAFQNILAQKLGGCL